MNPLLCFQPAAMVANGIVLWFTFMVVTVGTAGAWYYLARPRNE